MAWSDFFTRGFNSGSQNLIYDDIAAYYFIATLLLILACTLTYSLIGSCLNPFTNNAALKAVDRHPLFIDKVKQYKSKNRFKFVSCWFVTKLIILLIVLALVIGCVQTVRHSGEDLKNFDPFEILGIEQGAPVEKVRKAFRRLALQYHPDRNPNDPDAKAKYLAISKAQQCLVSDQARQKCLKSGSPDGTPTSYGIALPGFLIHKSNHVIIMGLLLVLLVVVLPIILIIYHSQSNKTDDFGTLRQTYVWMEPHLHRQLSVSDCIIAFGFCKEFESRGVTREQIAALEKMKTRTDPSLIKQVLQKNLKSFIKKSVLLIQARLNRRQIPQQLEPDMQYISKTIPMVLKSMINMIAARSTVQFANHPQMFGTHGLKSMIMFSQYFLQGVYLDDDVFDLIPVTADELTVLTRKLTRNKQRYTMTKLLDSQQLQDTLYKNISEKSSDLVKQYLSYWFVPKLQLTIDGQSTVPAGSSFQVVLTVTAPRYGGMCLSKDFPYLKSQGWYLLIGQGQLLYFFNYITFQPSSQPTIEHKQDGTTIVTSKLTMVAPQKQGEIQLNVCLMSDCYPFQDREKIYKIHVGPAQKQDLTNAHTEAHQELKPSFFEKMLQAVRPEQEEEVSDQSDGEGEEGSKGRSQHNHKKDS